MLVLYWLFLNSESNKKYLELVRIIESKIDFIYFKGKIID